MTGSELLVKSLENEGVTVMFAYPGGSSMEIHQALTRSSIRTILPRHEQGGVFAAEGYARATGEVGVCMATSGPGATNLVTGIADAYMDSTPLVIITGQVPLPLIGRGAFQEIDIFGITLPIVKHSYLITDIKDIPGVVKEAFLLAKSGRPGPVLIDLPKNLQQAQIDFDTLLPSQIKQRNLPTVPASVITQIWDLLQQAQRPVLYVGGGIISANASSELVQFATTNQIPVTTTLMGCGAFPEEHPLSLRWLGMHGAAYANWAVNGEYKLRASYKDPLELIAAGADLLLAFGVRFDDRVTGKLDQFCKHGTIVHIDIDASEINKNKTVHIPVVGEIRHALTQLNKRGPINNPAKHSSWLKQLDSWKDKAPFGYVVNNLHSQVPHLQQHITHDSQVILPQFVIESLYELTQGDAIITTGVGQHQMWAAQYYKFKQPRQLITSCGLGTMGFGLPAAIGAKVAFPNKQVVDIDGDGSFLMNIQELATAHIEKIPVKVIILNNQHLGMVMQWEDRFYKGNRGNTYLGNPDNQQQLYPNFPAIMQGFGIACERVMYLDDLHAEIQRMLQSTEPYVLEVIVPHTEHVLPFIPTGQTVADMRLYP